MRVHLPSGNGFFFGIIKYYDFIYFNGNGNGNVCAFQSVYLGYDFFLSLFKELTKKRYSM